MITWQEEEDASLPRLWTHPSDLYRRRAAVTRLVRVQVEAQAVGSGSHTRTEAAQTEAPTAAAMVATAARHQRRRGPLRERALCERS